MKRRSLCVFCGSRAGDHPAYADAARDLGTAIGRDGWRLVYGGGRVGLMGIVADAAIAAGAETIGVIPRFLQAREVAHSGLDDTILTDGMHDRKQIMFDLAEGFVVLPGGFGTLDETIEILTWRQLDRHRKPIVLIDVDGYWQPFVALARHVIDHGFAPAEVLDFLTVVPDVPSAMARFG